MMRCLVPSGLLIFLLAQSAEAQTTQLSQSDALTVMVRSLHWRSGVIVPFPASKSELRPIDGYSAVTADEASRLRAAEDPGNDAPGLEAEVVNAHTGAEAVFAYDESGYVRSTDWGSVDSTAFLDQIRKNTDSINPERVANHLPTMTVTDWVQPPTLNTDTHTITWMFKAVISDGRSVLNAVALKLGRFGVERIVFIDDSAHESSALQTLLLIANAHQFDAGARYSDFVAGTDHAAAYGVAGLVAGVMGVKLLQVAAAGGLIILAKKFAFLIFLPFIWLWRVLRPKKTKPLEPPTEDPVPPVVSRR